MFLPIKLLVIGILLVWGLTVGLALLAKLFERARGFGAAPVDDRIFGELEWDGSWRRRISLGVFGGSVRLMVEGSPRRPPTEAQRQAFRSLSAGLADVHGAVQEANWVYYRKVVRREGRFRILGWRPRAASTQRAPDLEAPAEVWTLLDRPALHVPRDQGKGWNVILSWRCTWDPERRHQARVENGGVVWVGGSE